MQSSIKTYTLAYSPCPNDTYIFAALTNGLLDGAPDVRVQLSDIEELNKAAESAEYELTKVSYGAIPHLMKNYRILRAGGALGRGCGPLVVTKPDGPKTLADLRDTLVAIPGERTTAFMLLQLALGFRPQAIQMRFDGIIEAVASGMVGAGLIIHESRFTYQEAGLTSLCDLGEWWEQQTGKPIPLGAILARNDVSDEAAHEINEAIRDSLRFSQRDEKAVMPYVREHAFEMSEEVMHKHIALYVNEFSDDLGDDGIAAVYELFTRARAANILQADATPRFSH